MIRDRWWVPAGFVLGILIAAVQLDRAGPYTTADAGTYLSRSLLLGIGICGFINLLYTELWKEEPGRREYIEQTAALGVDFAELESELRASDVAYTGRDVWWSASRMSLAGALSRGDWAEARRTVAIPLGHALRRGSSALPGSCGAGHPFPAALWQSGRSPIRACSGRGLPSRPVSRPLVRSYLRAPRGPDESRDSHHFTFTGEARRARGRATHLRALSLPPRPCHFCGTFRRVTPPRNSRAPCPMEAGLSSEPSRTRRPPGPLSSASMPARGR